MAVDVEDEHDGEDNFKEDFGFQRALYESNFLAHSCKSRAGSNVPGKA